MGGEWNKDFPNLDVRIGRGARMVSIQDMVWVITSGEETKYLAETCDDPLTFSFQWQTRTLCRF